ncbi:MAG: protein-disulfide reductase DsbD family protein [Hylemonella sp.]|uniref:protein-disulfide reductase DsbD family protein n=1 Tax=Hylemonella sp. TaxID=2066020 RepID=UPI0022BC3FC5|nr:protein-disulfide reductase DsbD domain-containing protein [Hylemonella sp.]MCZ8253987.1 protein-disulfide reductase DsbD family protein [Hylemonella sp.]
MAPQRLLRSLLAPLFTAAVLFAPCANAQIAPQKTVVTTPQARTELLAHAPEGVAPGRTVWVGLRIEHKEHWHTYWKNPGDSGLPTELQWTLPAGVQAGDIAWPMPQKIPVGPLMNYGYEGTLLLPVPLTITSDFKPGLLGQDLPVQLRASWLICKTECIPEEGEYTLRIPLRGSTALHGALFEAAQQAQPRMLAAAPASGIRIAGQTLKLAVTGLPERLRGQKLEAFPEVAEVVNPAAPWTQRWEGAVWTAELPLAPQRSASPQVLPVVLANGNSGWRVELPVRDAWPATAAPAAISPALQAALDANAAAQGSAPTLGFWAALAGALIGGLILNLMPCVFPVLAIKVLSFTKHADDHRRHRLSGLAYTAGVIVSFLALGLLLLGLRSAGASLGWGFQLQDPLVIAALAALFTVIALNLAGVFEFGQFAPSSLAAFQARHPVVDAFLTGVLAVAVASPCTAPFMGASLGLAITLPAGQALLIFAALGLGLAGPYLVASFVPAFARWLPRPGAWMDTLRKLLAFPMLITVVWLVWVLGHQSGVDGAAALLVLLVALSALIWALTLRGRLRAVLAGLLLASGAWSVWALGPYMFQNPAPQAQAADARWQAWSPARQQELLAAGKTVFVDYTAAWCVTCQYNKQTTLADTALLGEFDARGVVMLRADWTRRDPAITTALGQLGRSGVPVYVFYRADRAPLVLSEVLSTGEVRQALNSL